MFTNICAKCGSTFEAKAARKLYCSWKCRPSSSPEARAKNNIDKEKLALRNNRWKKNNPDKSYASLKKWRANNPEKAREINRNWELSNPDKLAEKRANSRINRRARTKSAFVSKVVRSEIFERDGWICMLCFEPIDKFQKAPHPKSPSVDHIIPLSKGGIHAPSNVQCTHLGCNKKKHARVPPT